jgi:hypothetical protein
MKLNIFVKLTLILCFFSITKKALACYDLYIDNQEKTTFSYKDHPIRQICTSTTCHFLICNVSQFQSTFYRGNKKINLYIRYNQDSTLDVFTNESSFIKLNKKPVIVNILPQQIYLWATDYGIYINDSNKKTQILKEW